MTTPADYAAALAGFNDVVHQIKDDQWSGPTPCSEWDVRALVRHMVYENVWVKPLFDGMTIAEVGDQFEGDLLGDDPIGAWDRSAKEATDVTAEPGAADRIVHLSFGDVPGSEYLQQLTFDAVIHRWDLATAIGVDGTIPAPVAERLLAWIEPQIDGWTAGGAFAKAVPVPADADAHTRLIAITGRNPAQ